MSIANWKRWKKKSSTPLTALPLPQEIIDQIIDEVAGQCYQEGNVNSFEPLRACSLVSKSFNTRARHHIFSHIDFTIDKYGRRRAARLLKILGNDSTDNSTLRNIHTLKISCNQPMSEQSFRSVGLGEVVTRPWKRGTRILNRNDYIYNLLKVLSRSPIVQFTLLGWRPFPYRLEWQDNCLMSYLLRIIANPSLRILRFSKLYWPPQKLIKNAFYSPGLRELTLCAIADISVNEGPEDDEEVPNRPIAKLERLDLIDRVPYRTLLSILRTLTSNNGVAPGTAPTFPEFSHLRILVVSTTKLGSEMDALWEIILGIAAFLEILVITHVGTQDNPWPSSACLSRLKALRYLQYNGYSTTSTLNVECLTNLLISANSPMTLESVDVNLYIQCGRPHDIASLAPSVEWEHIDYALNTGMFGNLTAITFSVRPFFLDKTLSFADVGRFSEPPDTKRIDPMPLLPRTASSPSVDLNVQLMSIFNGYQMLGHDLLWQS
ncbi:hypothetical protein CVT25_007365 [Psilocybe cyanescens]|uniref:F-box domain-containing protein n=1 Tax=Psilocybe cyanescens TaxID=93625 RepID=A0A409XJF7_PSICY|nr:hypothetical protein CVT25_007365 [Psilocybe cyanescens]